MTMAISPLLVEMQKPAHEVLAQHGKTFNWAKRFLGEDAGQKAAILYRFCRFADDVADSTSHKGSELIENMRASIYDDAIEVPELMRSFLEFSDRNGIDRKPIYDLLTGLKQDQGSVALKSEDELILYSYRVAGTVGLMMLPLIGATDPKARAFAIDLGIAMQLTNIARDIYEDAQMGRRYIPATICNNMSSRLIRRGRLIPMHQQQLRASAQYLLRLADKYYASAYRGLAYLPLRSHLAIAVAGYCYQAIGHKIKRQNYAVWKGRTVVSLIEKIGASFMSLASLRFRFTRLKPHENALHLALHDLRDVEPRDKS